MAKSSPKKDLLIYQKNGPDLAAACARLAAHNIADARFAEALLFAKKARDLDIEAPENALNIAECLAVMGKYLEAEQICREALEKEPKNRRGLILIGQALVGQEKYSEAEEPFNAALALGEGNGEVLIDLGFALEGKGDDKKAEDYFDQAKSEYPELFEDLMNRADLLYQRFLNNQAREVLKRAEKIAMRDASAYLEMGMACYFMGFAEEAEKHLKTSIRLRPSLEAYRNLAELYEKSNELEKAETFARANLQSAPDEPSLNLVMAHAEGRQGKNDEALARYQKVLEVSEPGPIMIDALNQSGRILDKAGKIDEAYKNFAAAKEMVKLNEDFETVDLKAQHKKIADMEKMDWSGKAAPPPPPEPEFSPGQLVFLIGFPRSGTTLLQEILGRHEKVVVTEEEPTLRKVVDMVEGFEGGYPGCLPTLSPEIIKDLRAVYFHQAKNFARFDETTTLIDKMPLNLMQVPLILTVFPDAKIIFALRHPKGTILSCLMQNFKLNNAMVNMTGLNEITNFYALLMGMWKKVSAMREIPFHYIKYEDLVADMETETKNLTKFLELGWAPEMMDFTEGAQAKGLINTPSYHQVVQPVYTGSLEKWQQYNKYLEPFEARLKPFYELFGYSG